MVEYMIFLPFIDVNDPKSGGEFLNAELAKRLSGNENTVIVNTKRPLYFNRGFFIRMYALCICICKLVYHKPKILITDCDYHSSIFFVAPILKLFGIKLVVILHHLTHLNAKSTLRKYFERVTEKIFLGIADKVMVISDAEVEEATRMGVAPYKIHVVSPAFKKPKNIHYKINKSKTVSLLFVGTIYERKNVETLLMAVELLNVKNWHLIIAGSLNEKSDYGIKILNMIGDHSNKEKISILGRVTDSKLHDLYTSSDVFILPSTYEGFGLVALEAHAFGLPVIASNVGGIPEIVEDGKTGILFKTSDVRSCAQAIELLISNDLVRNSMSRNAINKAMQYQGERSFAEQCLDIIRR